MRRLITLFFLVFTLSGVAFAQQMSDDQVVQYVKSAQQMGKNQKQITTELMRRGVTKEQVERIQKKYENSKSGSPQSNTQDEKRSRQRGEMSGVVKGLRTTSETYSARQTDVAGDSLQMMDNRSLSQEKETERPYKEMELLNQYADKYIEAYTDKTVCQNMYYEFQKKVEAHDEKEKRKKIRYARFLDTKFGSLINEIIGLNKA